MKTRNLILIAATLALAAPSIGAADLRLGTAGHLPEAPSPGTAPSVPAAGIPYCDRTATAAWHACQAAVRIRRRKSVNFFMDVRLFTRLFPARSRSADSHDALTCGA